MMIQSVTKTPRSTSVVVLNVPMEAREREVLLFLKDARPFGTISTDIRLADDYSGVVSAKGANVTFWTD